MARLDMVGKPSGSGNFLRHGNSYLTAFPSFLYPSAHMVFHAFPRVPSERFVCFDVENFDEALAHDPAVIERFEMDAGHHGFLAAHVDQPTNTICVSVTDPSLTDTDVAAAVAAFGFVVQLKPREGKPDGKAGEQFRQT